MYGVFFILVFRCVIKFIGNQLRYASCLTVFNSRDLLFGIKVRRYTLMAHTIVFAIRWLIVTCIVMLMMVGFLRISVSNLFSFLIMSKSKKNQIWNTMFSVVHLNFKYIIHGVLIYDLRLPYYG